MRTIFQQHMNLLSNIGYLQIKLGSMIDDFYFEDTDEYKLLLSCIDRQMEILQNNYSKTRAYPLSMLEMKSDNTHRLNPIFISIVSLLFSLGQLNNGYCSQSILKATSAMACRSVHRFVDDNIRALLQENVLDMILDAHNPNDPLIKLEPRFMRRLTRERNLFKKPVIITQASFIRPNMGLMHLTGNAYYVGKL